VDYQYRSGTLSFGVSDITRDLPTISLANDFAFNGDRTFFVKLSNPTAGARIAYPATASVTILDDDGVGVPDLLTNALLPSPLTPPASSGVLVMSLDPTNCQWRLIGDDAWHNSGDAVTGLTANFYQVELKPLTGYLPHDPVTVSIDVGTTNYGSASYTPNGEGQGGPGQLQVIIQPASVATNVDVNAQGLWQLQGEQFWRNSTNIVSVPPGYYTILFKDASNRTTPPTRQMLVKSNQLNTVEGIYFATATSGQTPQVLSSGDATTNVPYLFNGQIRTRLGFGSGFVVKPRVILTAAHVLFDDRLLTYVPPSEVYWLFHKQKGDFEPVPQTPRGWYRWDDYAAQRQVDNSPGESSPASQNLDVAAVYFVEAATDPNDNFPGAHGYGGYLYSDALDNEWLDSSRLKMLVGYPLDGIIQPNRGKMHATPPANLSFVNLYQRVFSTSDIRSFPGNSGGPLYVQYDDGNYYPAGIFLGGSAQTLVRAIDSDVVDLINRAEISANEAGNSTGGGVALWDRSTAPPFVPGLFRVDFEPVNLGSNGAAWRVLGGDDPTWINSTNLYYPLTPGAFNIEFRPVPGFSPPPNRQVSVVVDQTTTIDASYTPIAWNSIGRLPNGSLILTLGGATGRVYDIQFSTNLVSWTDLISLTNSNGTSLLTNPPVPGTGRAFFRAKEKLY
jgi:hypothetical protein